MVGAASPRISFSEAKRGRSPAPLVPTVEAAPGPTARVRFRSSRRSRSRARRRRPPAARRRLAPTSLRRRRRRCGQAGGRRAGGRSAPGRGRTRARSNRLPRRTARSPAHFRPRVRDSTRRSDAIGAKPRPSTAPVDPRGDQRGVEQRSLVAATPRQLAHEQRAEAERAGEAEQGHRRYRRARRPRPRPDRSSGRRRSRSRSRGAEVTSEVPTIDPALARRILFSAASDRALPLSSRRAEPSLIAARRCRRSRSRRCRRPCSAPARRRTCAVPPR